jgi:GAF domain-containing protein
VPYLVCSNCALPTYVVSEGSCPACGNALRGRGAPIGPRPARTDLDRPVRAELAVACRELDMDSALLAEIVGRREVVRYAAGEGNDWVGTSTPLNETICARLLDGRIGAIVGDAADEQALASVPAVRDGSIGAYLGVTFRTGDARLYALCCLAAERRPDLSDGDLRFLQGMAASIRSLVEAAST